jgi:hypothetical protein
MRGKIRFNVDTRPNLHDYLWPFVHLLAFDLVTGGRLRNRLRKTLALAM